MIRTDPRLGVIQQSAGVFPEPFHGIIPLVRQIFEYAVFDPGHAVKYTPSGSLERRKSQVGIHVVLPHGQPIVDDFLSNHRNTRLSLERRIEILGAPSVVRIERITELRIHTTQRDSSKGNLRKITNRLRLKNRGMPSGFQPHRIA